MTANILVQALLVCLLLVDILNFASKPLKAGLQLIVILKKNKNSIKLSTGRLASM